MSEQVVPEDNAAFLTKLRSYVGKKGESFVARDLVNQAMVRHWCDAIDDRNPVYTDPAAGEESIHGEIVAPPAMLDVWTMSGNIQPVEREDPRGSVLRLLEQAGFTSVVATNTEHEYFRYLKLGEHISGTLTLTDVSEEKQTALGTGHFVTSVTQFHNQTQELVGAVTFRILMFKPGTGRVASAGESEPGAAPKAVRPRPGISRDTQFFWDGCKQDELRIQKCAGCGRLSHPPVVRCPKCGSYELGYQVASGKAKLYSFVEPVHPQMPFMTYPYIVGLVELEEGTRLLTNVVDVDPEQVWIGMPLTLVFRETDPDLNLPMFQPAKSPRNEGVLRFEDVEVGQKLPLCPIAITTKLIVAAAIATRDYQDVHHDVEMAKKRGSPNIFMNILTTAGLCTRYVGDWVGSAAKFRSLNIRLGVPNYPGDTMTMSGAVISKSERGGKRIVQIGLRGYNHLGNHVTGTVQVELLDAGAKG